MEREGKNSLNQGIWSAPPHLPNLSSGIPPLPTRKPINSSGNAVAGVSSQQGSAGPPAFHPSQQSSVPGGPPLPARNGGAPTPAARNPAYAPPAGFGSMFGGGGYSSMSPYSRHGMPYYSPVSSYGGGYPSTGGYGSYPAPNGFISLAEQSVLPAFQSIESIVHAFGSVSMMLESTYHAVRASFQAVLGVADNLSRVKLQVSQAFSALAAFRMIKYLYRKLLYLLGGNSLNPAFQEMVWQSGGGGGSLDSQQALTEMDLKSPAKWPILVYLGVTFLAPYLIWKLINSITRLEAKEKDWRRGEGEHFIAKALHPFHSQQSGDLSFGEGQMLVLAPRHLQPREAGWLLASFDGNSGVVPANYIKIFARRTGKSRAPRPDLIKESATSEDELDSLFDQNSTTGSQG